MMFFGLTEMAIVMAMSIERLLSIRYAFLYREKASAHKVQKLFLCSKKIFT